MSGFRINTVGSVSLRPSQYRTAAAMGVRIAPDRRDSRHNWAVETRCQIGQYRAAQGQGQCWFYLTATTQELMLQRLPFGGSSTQRCRYCADQAIEVEWPAPLQA